MLLRELKGMPEADEEIDQLFLQQQSSKLQYCGRLSQTMRKSR